MGKEREEIERVGKRKRGDREGWEEKERRVRGLGKEREEIERVGKRGDREGWEEKERR